MPQRLSRADRERLKAEFFEEARLYFESMFSPQEQSHLVTFDERESRAVEMGQKLTRWILEHNLAGDDSTTTPCRSPGVCPFCAAPVAKSKEAPEKRSVQTRAGPVEFERARAYCAQCRRAFFPSGRPARAGD